MKKYINRLKQELIKEFLYFLPTQKPKKIIFDHLPKCGGSSLNGYLEAHYPRRKTFSIDCTKPASTIDSFKKLPQRVRHGYDLVKGHRAYELLDYVDPECLKITMLREPVDRIVSHYYYALTNKTHYLYSKIRESEMDLQDYATSDLSEELRNFYTTHFSSLLADEAEKNPEESVRKAFDNILRDYDVVGFLDEFSNFTNMIRDRALLKKTYQNERINTTKVRPSLSKVSESDLNAIKRVNSLDIILYERLRSEQNQANTPIINE